MFVFSGFDIADLFLCLQQLAEKNGMKFIETSSRNATNVDSAFRTIAQQLIELK